MSLSKKFKMAIDTESNISMSFRGSAGPITSVSKLAEILQVSEAYLRDVAARPDSENYKPAKAPDKKNGTPRKVYSPSKDVRLIQRRLVEVFFKDKKVVSWPKFIYGGIHRKALMPGDRRDHVACAQAHCGAKSMVKLDIEDFFDNVSLDLVEHVFSKLLRWSTDVSRLAAKLCTREGCLPQGGITSSYIALLCIFDVEPRLVRTLGYKHLTYTRYVDDITISSRAFHQDFTNVIKMVEQMLMAKGLVINARKVEQQSLGLQAMCVHGLNISFDSPVLPKIEVLRIKQVCRQTAKDAREVGRRSVAYRRRYYRAMGLVNKLARVGGSHHRKFVSLLRETHPLPAFADYKISTDIGFNLREKYIEKRHGYWYWKRFNRLMARLDLIGVDNKGWAKTLRTYMKRHFKPEYRI